MASGEIRLSVAGPDNIRIPSRSSDAGLRPIGKLRFKKGQHAAAATAAQEQERLNGQLDKALVCGLKSDILLVQSKIDAMLPVVHHREAGNLAISQSMMDLEHTLLKIHPREDEAGQTEVKVRLYELLLSKLKELFGLSSTGLTQAREEEIEKQDSAMDENRFDWSLLLQPHANDTQAKYLPPAALNTLTTAKHVSSYPGRPVAGEGLRGGPDTIVVGLLDMVDVCRNVLLGCSGGIEPLAVTAAGSPVTKYYNHRKDSEQSSNQGLSRLPLGLGGVGSHSLPPVSGTGAATSQIPFGMDQIGAMDHLHRPPSSSSRPASRGSSAHSQGSRVGRLRPPKPDSAQGARPPVDKKHKKSDPFGADAAEQLKQLQDQLTQLDTQHNTLKDFIAKTLTGKVMQSAVSGLDSGFLDEFDEPKYKDGSGQTLFATIKPTSPAESETVPTTPATRESKKPGSRSQSRDRRKSVTGKRSATPSQDKRAAGSPLAGAPPGSAAIPEDPQDVKQQRDALALCVTRQNGILNKLQSYVQQLRKEVQDEAQAAQQAKKKLEVERDQMMTDVAATEVKMRQEVAELREALDDAKREKRGILAAREEAKAAKNKKLPTVTTKNDPPMLHEQEAIYQQTIVRKDRYIRELTARLDSTQKELADTVKRNQELGTTNHDLDSELTVKRKRLAETSDILRFKLKETAEMEETVNHERALRELQMERNVEEGEKSKNLEFELMHVRRKLQESEEDFAEYREESEKESNQQKAKIKQLTSQVTKMQQELRHQSLEFKKTLTPLKASLNHFMQLAAHERNENKGHNKHLDTHAQLQDKLHQVQHEFANWASAKQIQQTTLAKQVDNLNETLGMSDPTGFMEEQLAAVTKERDALQKEMAQMALHLSYQLKPNENVYHTRQKGMLDPHEGWERARSPNSKAIVDETADENEEVEEEEEYY
eukprot:TRINITY_DN67868_c4_g1_i14.p1 TRINITY_DN67868_c4_g1~~TRINITY_DN67868_c4_g1_i14.p1  ORF type:complete len:938 (-),score=151.89 TRINITY_DN67868_c4_g1_i14:157-2970(-)